MQDVRRGCGFTRSVWSLERYVIWRTNSLTIASIPVGAFTPAPAARQQNTFRRAAG